jgi:hypothetical protein
LDERQVQDRLAGEHNAPFSRYEEKEDDDDGGGDEGGGVLGGVAQVDCCTK